MWKEVDERTEEALSASWVELLRKPKAASRSASSLDEQTPTSNSARAHGGGGPSHLPMKGRALTTHAEEDGEGNIPFVSPRGDAQWKWAYGQLEQRNRELSADNEALGSQNRQLSAALKAQAETMKQQQQQIDRLVDSLQNWEARERDELVGDAEPDDDYHEQPSRNNRNSSQKRRQQGSGRQPPQSAHASYNRGSVVTKRSPADSASPGMHLPVLPDIRRKAGGAAGAAAFRPGRQGPASERGSESGDSTQGRALAPRRLHMRESASSPFHRRAPGEDRPRDSNSYAVVAKFAAPFKDAAAADAEAAEQRREGNKYRGAY